MRTTKNLFITGTDTDCGKTYVSVALLNFWRRQGLTTKAFKPVATGGIIDPTVDENTLVNADAAVLLQAQTTLKTITEVNPWCFEPLTSPHIAAANCGIALDLETIAMHCLSDHHPISDVTLIEGAGGWFCPLNAAQQTTMADLAIALQIPVLLVVGVKLGCLNHALLTAHAIQHSNVTLAGWISNEPTPQNLESASYIEVLKAQINAPYWGHLKHNQAIEI